MASFTSDNLKPLSQRERGWGEGHYGAQKSNLAEVLLH